MANPGGGTLDTPRAVNDFDAGTVSAPTPAEVVAPTPSTNTPTGRNDREHGNAAMAGERGGRPGHRKPKAGAPKIL